MTDNFHVHSLAAAKTPRRKPAQRASDVQVKRVANWDAIYAYALDLADGDASRVTVTPEGEVIVRNRGKDS